MTCYDNIFFLLVVVLLQSAQYAAPTSIDWIPFSRYLWRQGANIFITSGGKNTENRFGVLQCSSHAIRIHIGSVCRTALPSERTITYATSRWSCAIRRVGHSFRCCQQNVRLSRPDQQSRCRCGAWCRFHGCVPDRWGLGPLICSDIESKKHADHLPTAT